MLEWERVTKEIKWNLEFYTIKIILIYEMIFRPLLHLIFSHRSIISSTGSIWKAFAPGAGSRLLS